MPLWFADPRQHRAIALAAVAPHDRAQRGVGLHRRAVDADPLALHQAALGHELQHPAEHRLVRLVRQTASACATATNDREPSRRSTAAGNRAARTSPRNATRCPARCRCPRSSRSCACGNTVPAKARRGHPRRVIRLARPFNEHIESDFPKQVLQAIVEHTPQTRHLRPRRHQIILNNL